MTIHLRDLADGCRFILLRTGQRFQLVRREKRKGRKVIVVRQLGRTTLGELNHQCVVRAMVKPRVKFKQKS